MMEIKIEDLKFMINEAKKNKDMDWTAHCRLAIIEQNMKDEIEFDEFSESTYHSENAQIINDFMSE